MLHKKLFLILLALSFPFFISAKEVTGGIKGNIVDRRDKSPLADAVLTLFKSGKEISSGKTNSSGEFMFHSIEDGIYELIVKAPDFMETRVNVTVNDGYVKNLFSIGLSAIKAEILTDLPDELDMDDSGYNDSPVVLYGQNDIFSNIAGYNFSSLRFRPRGYSSESQDVYLAGVKMNDAVTGYAPYSLWSGLNEATRTKSSVLGSEISNFDLGGYNGLTNIDAMASSVRKGWRGSILTNSALYRLRLMLTYASGALDNGWSYAFSFSTRLGGNDWVKGVYYRSFGYYGSLEKKFNDEHKLGFTIMAAPGERGTQNASTQEVYDLVKDNMYNSNWGYQNGKIRNSRVRISHEPITILKYDYTPSEIFSASATILYRFGRNGYTALDWYDAPDPRPDYYRNLPSYFNMEIEDLGKNDFEKAAFAAEPWISGDPHITHVNWDRLYSVNQLNRTADGLRSKYVVEERRADQKDFNAALSCKWNISREFELTGGFSCKINRTEHFKVLNDLLGGDYYLDVDQFAERDFASYPSMIQNNLDYFINNGGKAPSVKTGDKYGYDYYARIRNTRYWTAGKYTKGGFEAMAGFSLGSVSLEREGLVRKGLFPGKNADGSPIMYNNVNITELNGNSEESSFGRSPKLNFLTCSVKANVAYNIKGGHRLAANFGYFSDAPTFKQSFISPRTRNSVVKGLKNINTVTADASYIYSNNNTNLRVTAFITSVKNQTEILNFYDDSQNSFTNFAMTGIDQLYSGLEMGYKVPLGLENLYLQGVLSLGKYVYTSNPFMTQTMDNSAKVLIDNEEIPYWKSHENKEGKIIPHYIPGTPQFAASVGLNWNKNYWFVDWDVQYFDNSYLGMNPLFRTDMAVAGPDGVITPEEMSYMAAQEKLPSCFLMNLSVGKSWYIKYKYQIGFSLNARNLLNKTNVVTGGYEQSRLIYKTKSLERAYKFDPKYFYMSGFNYMLNIYFRF